MTVLQINTEHNNKEKKKVLKKYSICRPYKYITVEDCDSYEVLAADEAEAEQLFNEMLDERVSVYDTDAECAFDSAMWEMTIEEEELHTYRVHRAQLPCTVEVGPFEVQASDAQEARKMIESKCLEIQDTLEWEKGDVSYCYQEGAWKLIDLKKEGDSNE